MNVTEIKVSYHLPTQKRIKIHHSKDLYQVAINHWNMDTIQMQEEVKAILLNQANHVIGIYSLSKGGVSSSFVDIKLLMSVVLKCLASGIILVHNHPSGNLKPSKADETMTKRVYAACEILEIKLLDHIIISTESYFSFADNGKM